MLTAAPTRPHVVPYITQWSQEGKPQPQLVIRRGRLAFATERTYDRDEHGILWTRSPSQPGKGRPQYGKVHPLRQRIAMTRLLCQVCGKPADRNHDGVLWLLGQEADQPIRPDEQTVTGHPPSAFRASTPQWQLAPTEQRPPVARHRDCKVRSSELVRGWRDRERRPGERRCPRP
ncbi:hypothetical protein [Streptomyces otsuchiensis]|uniref:hypothetical protein n=1 Tax=Streptomyces otsuchiensis TaxID=2681388 RepID=UPI00102F8BF5|nr:hypothetical protein [Streptomyces otsuchiensis]